MTTTTTTAMHKIYCEHPDPDRQGTNVDQDKYDAMKKALLKHIPRRVDGVPFRGIVEAIRPLLPREVFAGASISWYVTTVKLDLEARGLIERVPRKKPQHLRRVRSAKKER